MTFKKIMLQLLSIALFSSSQLVVLAEEETADSVETEENAEVNDENKEVDPDDQIEINLDGPLRINQDKLLEMPSNFPTKLSLGPEAVVEYPEDGVKGIFSTGSTAGTKRFDELIDLVNSTELNSMVVDVKEDYGDIVLNLDSDNELINEATNAHTDAKEVIQKLNDNDIYPIARIVVFKDSVLAEKRPDLSFVKSDGSVWKNNRGEAFVNPYEKEVWEYNIEVAKAAAELGFRDIQFDYVRFPEGFEYRDEELDYGRGDYDESTTNVEQRVDSVNSFVEEARSQLLPYGVDVSVDIFGYAAMVGEAPGIGQSFLGISENVDVLSSMIYPSHWGPGNFGIEKPDLEPYNIINEYMKLENELLSELGNDAPRSRPWIQDFTASYLGSGNYLNYGAHEVTEQIRALHDNGVNEFLLWNSANQFSEDATFSFD
ncbi:MAG TPA: putative glycoside hydrolase [Alloiococcus sp.]|nr:putative glycoside hydrolase [Alloiococcus sp.]